MDGLPRIDNILTNSKVLARQNMPEGIAPKSRSRIDWAYSPKGMRRPCENLTLEAYAIRLYEEGRIVECREVLAMIKRTHT